MGDFVRLTTVTLFWGCIAWLPVWAVGRAIPPSDVSIPWWCDVISFVYVVYAIATFVEARVADWCDADLERSEQEEW